MDGSVPGLVSVEVCHWCEPVEGQPRRRSIVMVGRDHASAVAAWNTRAAPSAAESADGHTPGEWVYDGPGFDTVSVRGGPERAQGGGHKLSNLVALCRRCHDAVTDRLAPDWSDWVETRKAVIA